MENTGEKYRHVFYLVFIIIYSYFGDALCGRRENWHHSRRICLAKIYNRWIRKKKTIYSHDNKKRNFYEIVYLFKFSNVRPLTEEVRYVVDTNYFYYLFHFSVLSLWVIWITRRKIWKKSEICKTWWIQLLYLLKKVFRLARLYLLVFIYYFYQNYELEDTIF